MKFNKTISATLFIFTLAPSIQGYAHDGVKQAPASVHNKMHKKGHVAPDLFDDFEVSQPTNKILPVKAVNNRNRSVKVNVDLLWLDALTLNLFDDLIVTAVRDRLIDKVKGTTTWIGHVEGEPDSEVFLTVRGRSMSGTVRIGEALYEINLGANNLHEITQVDPSLAPRHSESKTIDDFIAEGGELDSTPSPDSFPSSQATTGSGTVIDIMVMYTSQALANASGQAGIETKIANAIAMANQAYINSDVDMQLNIVHMAEATYNQTGNMATTLQNLAGTNDGKMDEIHALRDQYGADQVVLLSSESDYCGIAYVMTNPDSSFNVAAFSVVHDDSRYACLSNNTLAHELGHNQGDQHDRASANTPGAYDYSYGYRICQTGGFNTIMAYSCSGAVRIGYFSNPNITYNGELLGTSADDNARSMNNTKAIVAAFRTSVDASTPNAPNNLSASALSDTEIVISWTDNSSNETGFRLERSEDAVDWEEFAVVGGNVGSFTDAGLVAETTYHYRVRAYNGNGNSVYSNISSATTNGAVVETCVRNGPLLTIAPNMPYSQAGAAVAYNVSLANQDSSVCDVTTFSIISNEGASLGSYSLSAGSATNASFEATAPLTDGSYTTSVTASSSVHENVTASATITVDGTAPSAPGNLTAAVKRNKQVTVSWNASTDTGSGVDHYTVKRDGSTIATTTSTSYIDKPGTGTFTYIVDAYDKVGNHQGSSVSVVVGKSTGRSNKK